jgi:glycosyltransferase involved in cell wall biosynthesis
MRRPMRILEITSYPPPRAGWGVRVQMLKRHLEADGHECVVLNIGQSRRIPSSEYETVLNAFDYLRKLWRFSARGYLAHVHVNGQSSQGFVIALTAAIVNLLCGRRCVLTFHGGIDQIYFPRPRYPWLRPMFWLLFALPRRIICNSFAVKQKIQEYGIPARKIESIQAFSRQYLEFQPRRLDERVEAFFLRFPVVVLSYINLRPTFFPAEMLEGFARAACRHPDWGLVLCGVVGYPEEDVVRATRERLLRADLADRVCVIDDLDHDEFLSTLSRSAVFLRSPVSDGVCSSVLEALSLRIPVVAAENGHRPPGVVTYVVTDPDNLAAVLEDVMSRRESLVAALPIPHIPDTLTVEADVLMGTVNDQKKDTGECAA